MRRLAAAAAALTLLLTACGPDLGSALTACQLITKTDIQKAIPEMKPKDGLGSGDETRSQCLYDSQSDRPGSPTVMITVNRQAGESGFEKDQATSRRKYGSGLKTLPGTGDAAFGYADPAGYVGGAEALKGDATVFISVNRGPDVLATVQGLMSTALGRL